MKKITAIICTLAMLAALTACNNNETSGSVPESGNGVSTPESTVDNSDSLPESGSPESTDNSVPPAPEQRLSDDQLKMISELKMQSFVGPDGETVLLTDAVDAVRDKNGGRLYDQENMKDEFGNSIFDENGMQRDDISIVDVMLTFDFAYLRYARPYFYAGEYIEDEERETLPEMEWFKVREGDKLDCGLTVKKAEFDMYPVLGWDNSTYLQTIELDGEITLEGMLFVTTNPNDYASKVGDLNFIADPTKTEGIPVVRLNHDRNKVYENLNRFMHPDYPEYIESDVYNMWYIGNIDDGNFDESSVFGGDQVVRVKVTLKNVKLDVFDEFAGGGFNGASVTAEIVDIERIDR